MTSLMRRLLPEQAAVAEVRGELTEPPLFPEEEALVARSVAGRRREFATGRRCARLSLAALGFAAAPLPSGPRGEPCWPPGVVGAISHCDGYRVAAAARATDLAGLGIDAEPAAPLPDGILEAVSLPEERADLARLAGAVPGVPWDRLLFSAKESVYKVWFPLARRPLGFDQARLRFTPGPGAAGPVHGSFSARLLVPVPPGFAEAVGGVVLRGRWLVGEGMVLTALAPPARPGGAQAGARAVADPIVAGGSGSVTPPGPPPSFP